MALGGDASLGTATFRITGDAQGATNAAAQANNALATMETAVAQNWWGLKNLGLAFAALPAAVAAGVGESVKQAAQLQDAMVGVARTADLMGKSNEAALGDLQDQLFKIGQTRATPTLEILGIAESAGALGVATDDIAAFTQVVTDLVSTTDLTATQASTGLARLAALTGTTSGGYDNLASSIMTTGVQTAATETEILGMSQRLAGLGAAIGLTAPQIIGWSAAILSAGIKTAEGGTQFQKTMIDITRAVGTGGKNLQAFANIAGVSSAALSETFKTSANEGMKEIVVGLGNIVSQGGNFVQFLDNAGIKENRQVKLLLQLAAAQANSANEHAKATYILDVAAKAYDNLERYQSAVEARNATFSARLQELRNTMFQTGAAIGSGLLGPMGTLISFVQTLAIGFGQISTPAKVLMAVILGVATVASALGAILLLLGPRLVLAWSAFQRLTGASATASGGLSGAATATREAATAGEQHARVMADQNNLLLQEAAAARAAGENLLILTGETRQAAGAEEQLAGATAQASEAQTIQAGTSSRLNGMLKNLFTGAQLTIAAMIGLATYTYAVGKAQEELDKKQKNAQQANNDLVEAMRRSGSAFSDQAESALRSVPNFERVNDSVINLGVSQTDFLGIVHSADPTAWQRFLDALNNSNLKGTQGAADLANEVTNLRKTWLNSAGDAGVATTAVDQQADSQGKLAEETAKTTAELKKFRDAQEAIAQAFTDYVDATIGALEADAALAESERNLADAQAKVADQAHYEQEAELQLVNARQKQADAVQAIADAELALSRARQDEANAVIDAQASLADAQASYADSLAKISDLEKAYADLQGNGLETTLAIEKATNKLADARLNLRKATLAVSDLEQNLAYLQQQGAGARDIQEAQLALAEAQQQVADSTTNVHDAQQELTKLTDPVERAKALAKAERDLDAARRDAAAKLRQIARDEQALADARRNQANDTAYKKATENLTQAQIDAAKAVDDIKTAEKNLSDIRGGSLTRDAEKAERAYEQQLLATAKAHVEVQKQTALMNGETWDAGRAARALADELGALNVKTQAAIDKRNEWIDTLSRAPVVPPKSTAEDQTPNFGDPNAPGKTPQAGDSGFALPKDFQEKAKADLMNFLQGLAATGGAFFALQLGAAIGKRLLGKIFGTKTAALAAEAATEGAAIGVAAGEAEVVAEAGAVQVGTPVVGASMAAANVEAGAIGAVGAATAGEEAAVAAVAAEEVGIVAGAPVVGGAMAAMTAAAGAIAAAAIPILLVAAIALIVIGIAALLLKDRNWQKVGDAIATGFSVAFDWVKDFIGNHWLDILLGVLLPGGPLIVAIKAFGGDIVHGLWDGLLAGLSWLLEWPRKIWDAVVDSVKRVLRISSPSGVFFELGGNIILGLIGGLMNGIAAVLMFFEGLGLRIVGSVQGAGSWLVGVGWNIISGLWNGVSDQWNNFYNNILSKVGKWIIDSIPNPFKILYNAGWDIVVGLWNGLVDSWNKMLAFGGSIVNWVIDHTVGELDSHSPSKVFQKIGQSIGDGLALGIADTRPTIQKQLDEMQKMMTEGAPSIDLKAMGLDAQAALDPFNGLAVNPGVYNAGQTVTNVYNDNLNQDIKTDADPDEIVSEWMFAKRVRSRS